MTTTSVQPKINRSLVILLGCLSILIVVSVLAGVNLTLGVSDRTAFFALALAGFTMCALGPLGRIAVTGWFNPLNILGYLVGALAIGIIAGVAFHLPFPWITTERSALFALAAVMVVKVGVERLYPRSA